MPPVLGRDFTCSSNVPHKKGTGACYNTGRQVHDFFVCTFFIIMHVPFLPCPFLLTRTTLRNAKDHVFHDSVRNGISHAFAKSILTINSLIKYGRGQPVTVLNVYDELSRYFSLSVFFF